MKSPYLTLRTYLLWILFITYDLVSKSNTIFLLLYILHFAHRLEQTFPGVGSFRDGRFTDMCRHGSLVMPWQIAQRSQLTVLASAPGSSRSGLTRGGTSRHLSSTYFSLTVCTYGAVLLGRFWPSAWRRVHLVQFCTFNNYGRMLLFCACLTKASCLTSTQS